MALLPLLALCRAPFLLTPISLQWRPAELSLPFPWPPRRLPWRARPSSLCVQLPALGRPVSSLPRCFTAGAPPCSSSAPISLPKSRPAAPLSSLGVLLPCSSMAADLLFHGCHGVSPAPLSPRPWSPPVAVLSSSFSRVLGLTSPSSVPAAPSTAGCLVRVVSVPRRCPSWSPRGDSAVVSRVLICLPAHRRTWVPCSAFGASASPCCYRLAESPSWPSSSAFASVPHTLIFASWTCPSLRCPEYASCNCSSALRHHSPWFSSLVYRCSVASLRCPSLHDISDLCSRQQKDPKRMWRNKPQVLDEKPEL
jgi:hypothetical protein